VVGFRIFRAAVRLLPAAGQRAEPAGAARRRSNRGAGGDFSPSFFPPSSWPLPWRSILRARNPEVVGRQNAGGGARHWPLRIGSLCASKPAPVASRRCMTKASSSNAAAFSCSNDWGPARRQRLRALASDPGQRVRAVVRPRQRPARSRQPSHEQPDAPAGATASASCGSPARRRSLASALRSAPGHRTKKRRLMPYADWASPAQSGGEARERGNCCRRSHLSRPAPPGLLTWRHPQERQRCDHHQAKAGKQRLGKQRLAPSAA
jgi:hypothetical protein